MAGAAEDVSVWLWRKKPILDNVVDIAQFEILATDRKFPGNAPEIKYVRATQ
jgi:hypothetical protein